MHNVLAAIFTADVLAQLEKLVGQHVPTHGKDVRNRHRILTAADQGKALNDLLQKAAWTMYIQAAYRSGLLPDEDLTQRLRSTDDDHFRGAMGECLAAWYLSSLGFEVKGKPESLKKTNVDLLISTQGVEIYVEVKSPCAEFGDGARTLRSSISNAGPQLKRGRKNLVVLCPALDMPAYYERKQLVEAAIGQLVYEVPVSLDGTTPPPGGLSFRQNGKLAKWHGNKAGAFTTDLTRVSAVLTIEPQYGYVLDEDRCELDHKALVVHNPFAPREHRIDRALFSNLDQWVINDEGDTQTMGWEPEYFGV